MRTGNLANGGATGDKLSSGLRLHDTALAARFALSGPRINLTVKEKRRGLH
jgi:hypothetical protein